VRNVGKRTNSTTLSLPRRTLLPITLTVAVALAGCQDRPLLGPDANADLPRMSLSAGTEGGITEAPDLLTVGNFRGGPDDDDGNPQTLVDFTFDQVAYINGGDHSNFHLVPLDGGDAVNARSIRPEADEEGDEVVTVLFRGDLDPADFARGFVDTGVVNSDCCNMGPDNPGNINQAAPISNDGRTDNPDLVSGTRDGDQVLFEFDQALTEEDIIQNTSGLRVYFPRALEGGNTIPEAGAIEVKRVDERTLRARFRDLPGDYRLRDAVGSFVTQGTVQGAEGHRGANDGDNAFDETVLDIDWPGSR
jgi:hypothetical protein